MELKSINKKGAIELSMTTVVVIVLAMTMLILGLTLVKNIFTGATYNVDRINQAVKDQIDGLFQNPDQKVTVNLPGQIATMKQGEEYGVTFGIRNIDTTTKRFDYAVVSEVGGNCPTGTNPQNWIVVGATGTPEVTSGDTYYGLVRFKPGLSTPLCLARFKLNVRDYAETFFDVEISAR